MRAKGLKWMLSMMAFFLFACAPTGEMDESTEQTDAEQTEEVVADSAEEIETETEEVDQTPAENELAEERLAQFYIDLMESGNYTLIYKGYWEDEGSEEEVQFVMSYLDEKIAMQIEDSSGANLSTMIMEQDEMHMVSHEEETIITMPFSHMYENFDSLQEFEEIEAQQLEYVGEGTGTFLGNTRDYEEYRDGSSHIFYYFDGETLDGMEFITDGESTVFDLESISPEVDESLFELPDHYERTSLNF